MKSLNDILNLAKNIGPKKVAVAQAEDEEVLIALNRAREENIIEGILVGDEGKITSLAQKNKINLDDFRIINQPQGLEACLLCCELIEGGKADLMMKGLVSTSVFLKAILDKEKGLRNSKLLSHVAVFQLPSYPKLLLLTDAAINIAPNLLEKAQIIQNAIGVAHCLGIENPLVACVAALEKVNPKMPATVDAAILSMMAKRGQITGALVDGPFGLDNAVSEESARIKGVEGPVAGKADIILVPDIECGNAIYKTLMEFAQAECAAIVAGTGVPVVLTSRADSSETKFMSIALGVVNRASLK